MLLLFLLWGQLTFDVAPTDGAGGPDVLGQLSSHQVLLNGKLLLADDQHGIPPLNPVVSPADAPLLLPPLSYAFSVYHDAAAAACSDSAGRL